MPDLNRHCWWVLFQRATKEDLHIYHWALLSTVFAVSFLFHNEKVFLTTFIGLRLHTQYKCSSAVFIIFTCLNFTWSCWQVFWAGVNLFETKLASCVFVLCVCEPIYVVTGYYLLIARKIGGRACFSAGSVHIYIYTPYTMIESRLPIFCIGLPCLLR